MNFDHYGIRDVTQFIVLQYRKNESTGIEELQSQLFDAVVHMLCRASGKCGCWSCDSKSHLHI